MIYAHRLARFKATAKKRNDSRDAIDRQYGNATPRELGPKEHLRTAMFAIAAGLSRLDWDCVAEGYVMLEEALEDLGPINPKR